MENKLILLNIQTCLILIRIGYISSKKYFLFRILISVGSLQDIKPFDVCYSLISRVTGVGFSTIKNMPFYAGHVTFEALTFMYCNFTCFMI